MNTTEIIATIIAVILCALFITLGRIVAERLRAPKWMTEAGKGFYVGLFTGLLGWGLSLVISTLAGK